jgi:hypothetical protein
LAFNKTVDIIELPKLVDFELIGLYCIMFAVIAAIGEACSRLHAPVHFNVRASSGMPSLGSPEAMFCAPQQLRQITRQWLSTVGLHTRRLCSVQAAAERGVGARSHQTARASRPRQVRTDTCLLGPSRARQGRRHCTASHCKTSWTAPSTLLLYLTSPFVGGSTVALTA